MSDPTHRDSFERIFGDEPSTIPPQPFYDAFTVQDSISLSFPKESAPITEEAEARMRAVVEELRAFAAVNQAPQNWRLPSPSEVRKAPWFAEDVSDFHWRTPPKQNIPMPCTEEEGNRLRAIFRKDRDPKLRTFFLSLNYRALESRLIRSTATANWTLQDYHWRDGEE